VRLDASVCNICVQQYFKPPRIRARMLELDTDTGEEGRGEGGVLRVWCPLAEV